MTWVGNRSLGLQKSQQSQFFEGCPTVSHFAGKKEAKMGYAFSVKKVTDFALGAAAAQSGTSGRHRRFSGTAGPVPALGCLR